MQILVGPVIGASVPVISYVLQFRGTCSLDALHPLCIPLLLLPHLLKVSLNTEERDLLSTSHNDGNQWGSHYSLLIGKISALYSQHGTKMLYWCRLNWYTTTYSFQRRSQSTNWESSLVMLPVCSLSKRMCNPWPMPLFQVTYTSIHFFQFYQTTAHNWPAEQW